MPLKSLAYSATVGRVQTAHVAGLNHRRQSTRCVRPDRRDPSPSSATASYTSRPKQRPGRQPSRDAASNATFRLISSTCHAIPSLPFLRCQEILREPVDSLVQLATLVTNSASRAHDSAIDCSAAGGSSADCSRDPAAMTFHRSAASYTSDAALRSNPLRRSRQPRLLRAAARAGSAQLAREALRCHRRCTSCQLRRTAHAPGSSHSSDSVATSRSPGDRHLRRRHAHRLGQTTPASTRFFARSRARPE